MKILFLQKRILFPSDTGWKARTLNVLRYLARRHDVTYLCNVKPEDAEHLDSMRELGIQLETIPWNEPPRDSWRFYAALARNCVSPYPFTAAKDYDPRLRARAEELLAADRFDVMICDFVQMARNAVGLPARASVLFQHNVEARILERHAARDRGWLRRRFMGHQWRKMRRFEAQSGRRFDAVIAVSEEDRRDFNRQYGWRHVHTIDTAVDVDYFHPNGEVERPDRIVFIGSMDWLPNQDGVRYFVEEIFPLIRRSNPRATFQIVGRNPSPGVRRLQQVDGVEVVGSVPDVRPYLGRAAVVVVPLLVGGGTRIKIFEAMAMGKAIVSTSLGAEGLRVTPREHLLLADTPDDFSRCVLELLADGPARARIGGDARRLVERHYCADAVSRQFDGILHQVLESSRSK